MNMIFRINTILLLSGMIACKTEAPESRTEKIAAAYCGCTNDLMTLNKRFSAMKQDSAAPLDLKQLETENNKALECAASIVGKYGKIKPAEIPQVRAIMLKKCPDWGIFPTEQLDNLLQEMMGE